ncbi:hypothetical protein L2E82_20508 [Cichorium intybus]|uniref:Uncharacterized protein n=1 Tax=Cichorium intybus TaxID=13427 RepID=A0ACB9DT41_CICIN|nr:hypothetical protein L2E82_20508 [Cichorium intybus]
MVSVVSGWGNDKEAAILRIRYVLELRGQKLDNSILEVAQRDYSPTFNQPAFHLRAKEARVEIGDFVEYDLDNEDEDWLQDFNKERLILPAENISRSRGPMIMTLIVFEDIDVTLYEDRGEPGRLQTQQILGNPITHKEVELKAIKVPSVII